jgi:uncharacterized protein (TIGR02001 family)
VKRVALWFAVVTNLTSTTALAADRGVKATPAGPAAAPPTTPVWDVAITGALMSDYNFRGITQSNHRPSAAVGFEPRYNINPNLQAYAGVSGESIDFPNRAAAEIDLYGGIRPTFGKLALDGGFYYYYYPDGQCFNTAALCGGGGSGFLPNGNVVKQNLSFYEWYGKGTYTVNDNFNFGGSIWYSPSVLNSGAFGVYYAGNVSFVAPSTWLPTGIGASLSGDVGYWQLGTSDAFYAVPAFPGGVPYPSYLTWDVGLTFAWKAFALDLRYYDTNLTKADCNVFTSDQTATFSPGNVTPQNPGGLGSGWCGATFIAKLSIATTINALK